MEKEDEEETRNKRSKKKKFNSHYYGKIRKIKCHTSKQSCLCMVVVFQQCFQCFHLSTTSLVILTGQTNVEEPQQIVNLLCLLSDAEKCQHRAALRTTTRTITTSVRRRIILTITGPSEPV